MRYDFGGLIFGAAYIRPSKVCITLILISPGYYGRPKRNQRQSLYKMFGGKNGVLWEMCKWRINFCVSANLRSGGVGGGELPYLA